MERELNSQNKSITDEWTLTNENFDKDTLLSAIIMKGGSFEPLYTNPSYFYTMCAMFWNKWERTFEKWFDALDIEYNPLENYDRQESWHEDITDDGATTFEDERSSTNTEVVDDDTTSSNTNVVDGTQATNGTTTNTVSAFDSASYSPHDKSEVDNTVDDDITTTDSGSTTDDRTTTTTYSDESTNSGTSTNDRDLDHTGRIHGNIGVTTSQQMLESELKVVAWNVYEHIADVFCKDLLITVY